MSNRDPLYGDTSKKDSFGNARDETPFGSSGELDNMSSEAKDKVYGGLDKADKMANDAQSKMDEGKKKADEMAGTARDRADQGMDKAADSMDKAADMLRQRGEEQGGTVGSMAGTAADAMESAGAYLHDSNTGEMMDQLETYIRKNPTQSLLIAAGVGFVLAKAFK